MRRGTLQSRATKRGKMEEGGGRQRKVNKKVTLDRTLPKKQWGAAFLEKKERGMEKDRQEEKGGSDGKPYSDVEKTYF